MLEFSLPLALFNFLPVALSALALFWLVRLLAILRPEVQVWAWSAATLIVIGGLSKALWKLNASLTGEDIIWLANALFPLIGPGFFLLAVLSWMAFSRPDPDRLRRPILVLAVLAIVLAISVALLRTWVLEVPRGWFLPFMLLTSLGNLALMVLLIRRAWQARLKIAVTLLVINVMVVFGLQPIAMAGADTLALHWLEQVMTTVGAAAFAFAVCLLLQAGRQSRAA
ncbi:MAG: hypothetical protein ACXIUM_14785 [Wenzhouxiangella sp.]